MIRVGLLSDFFIGKFILALAENYFLNLELNTKFVILKESKL